MIIDLRVLGQLLCEYAKRWYYSILSSVQRSTFCCDARVTSTSKVVRVTRGVLEPVIAAVGSLHDRSYRGADG
jgi:hypothetical protein